MHTLGPCGSLQDLSCEAGSLPQGPPPPPWAFSIRSLRLNLPELEPWAAWSASLPAVRRVWVHLCANVGSRGATHCSACPALRHSESGPLSLSVCECGAAGSASAGTACAIRLTLCLSGSRHSHVSALHPVSAPPTGLDECLFFISLVLDPLAIRFSVSSGFARRLSVSTYAAILVLTMWLLLMSQNAHFLGTLGMRVCVSVL